MRSAGCSKTSPQANAPTIFATAATHTQADKWSRIAEVCERPPTSGAQFLSFGMATTRYGSATVASKIEIGEVIGDRASPSARPPAHRPPVCGSGWRRWPMHRRTSRISLLSRCSCSRPVISGSRSRCSRVWPERAADAVKTAAGPNLRRAHPGWPRRRIRHRRRDPVGPGPGEIFGRVFGWQDLDHRLVLDPH